MRAGRRGTTRGPGCPQKAGLPSRGGDWNPNKLNLGPLPLPFPGPSSEEEDPRLKGKRWPLTGTESGPVPDGHRQLRDGGGGAAAAGGKQPSGRLSPGSALGSARLKETAAAAVKGGWGGNEKHPQVPAEPGEAPFPAPDAATLDSYPKQLGFEGGRHTPKR